MITRWILPSLCAALVLFWLYSFSIQSRDLIPVIKNDDAQAKGEVSQINVTLPLFPKGFEMPQLDAMSGMKTTLKVVWNQLVEEKSRNRASSMVLGNFVRRKKHPLGRPPARSSDIGLVTHCEIAKLENLLTQLENWSGPASVAVYIDDGDTQIDRLVDFILRHQDVLRLVSIHVYLEYYGDAENPGYPHNVLRNLAMDQSEMSFALAADVDLIPGPPNCYQHIMKSFAANDYEIPKMMRSYHTAMVLPAFGVLPREGEFAATPDQLPGGKKKLMKKLEEQEIIVFHSRDFRPGQNATDFPRWYSFPQVEKSKIGLPPGDGLLPEPTFYPIEYQAKFEPYVLVYKPGLPRYWESFRGYGYNKYSWIMEMHRAGYEFATLTQQYFVHLSHNSSSSTAQRRKNYPQFQEFIEYLDSKYPLVDNRPLADDKKYIQFTAGKKP